MKWEKNKLTFNTVIHYILIYIMILIPGSSLFQKIMPSSFTIVLFAIFVLLSLLIKKLRNYFTFIPLIVVTIFALLVRMISGGIGVNAIIDVVLPLFALNVAFNYDKKKFLTRFVNVSTIFFSISLLFFVIQIINRNFFSVPLFKRFYSQSIGTYPWQKDYYGNGFILFSSYEIHPTRNCGIFTEPGVYQINIISCLSILLFFNNSLYISKKRINISILISIITLITAQSTTGFIALVALFIMYSLFYKNKNRRITKYVYIIGVIAFIALIIDYLINKDSSILYVNFISKIFVDGKIGFDNGTGQYRIGTLRNAINCMINNPLGVGYDNFSAIDQASNAGAGFFAFGAIFGIVPFLILFLWMIYPYISHKKFFFLILFLIIFFNTTMAQTYFLYPGLLIINYYFYFNEKQRKEKKA